MQEEIKNEFAEIIRCFTALDRNIPEIEKAVAMCVETLRAGNKIMFCGNGGSAADAQHLAAELVGRYKKNRRALAGLALTTDTSNLTAISNDYSYDEVFSRQIEGLGRPGDVLYALSTSGNSRNVVLAMELARTMGIQTIALTGESGGLMKPLADIAICVPAKTSNHIQEMHIAVGHLICGYIENLAV